MRSQAVRFAIRMSDALWSARCFSDGDVLTAARFSKGLPMDTGDKNNLASFRIELASFGLCNGVASNNRGLV